jgi:hypothetical protein
MQISQSETRIACDGHAVHRYFLPIFSSFGGEVSEEMIKMRKVNRRRTPSDGKGSHCLWEGELIKI